VTAVGGTTLTLTSAGTRISPDVVWNDDTPAAGNRVLASGGGLSRFFSRPTYQNTVLSIVGEHRGVPDIAMSASCSAMVDVYESFAGSSGWGLQCGTSEATPLFAGIIALADQEARHGLGLINPALYALMRVAHNGIVDVTSGNNTVTVTNAGSAPVTVPGYDAATGYDLASGVGTVNAALFVPALVKQAASP
jgi:subtilase family serine protease